MLSIFPSLLDWGFFAPTLLRFVVGIIFMDLGYLMLTSERKSWNWLLRALGFGSPHIPRKILGYIEIIGGGLLFVGLYTQCAALILSIIIFAELLIEYKEPSFIRRDLAFYIMLLTMTISLLLLGAGALAFDLPL